MISSSVACLFQRIFSLMVPERKGRWVWKHGNSRHASYPIISQHHIATPNPDRSPIIKDERNELNQAWFTRTRSKTPITSPDPIIKCNIFLRTWSYHSIFYQCMRTITWSKLIEILFGTSPFIFSEIGQAFSAKNHQYLNRCCRDRQHDKDHHEHHEWQWDGHGVIEMIQSLCS